MDIVKILLTEVSPSLKQDIVNILKVRLTAAQKEELALSMFSGEYISILKEFLTKQTADTHNLLRSAISKSQVDLVDFLTLFIGVNVTTDHLVEAISNNNIDVLRIVLQSGVSPRADDHHHPMGIAIENEQFDVVQELLLAGVDLNDPNEEIIYSLISIGGINIKMAEMVLANGFDVKDQQIELAFFEAQNFVELLEQYGAIVIFNDIDDDDIIDMENGLFWYEVGGIMLQYDENGAWFCVGSADGDGNLIPLTTEGEILCDRL